MTKKKITKVEASKDVKMPQSDKKFVPSEENKKKATTNRVIAIILWAVSIGLEIYAITLLNKAGGPNITLLVALIVVMAILAISGSLLWKKSNRLDPASESNKVKFFIQNQLGMILALLAFIPLIILVLMDEDLEGKDKGIVTIVAIIALGIAGAVGVDPHPVSAEQFQEEINLAESLRGEKYTVYWTQHGKVYHLYEDCHHINRVDTKEIFEGNIPAAYEHKNITEMCKTCSKRAEKEISLGVDEGDIDAIEENDD